MSSIPPTAAAQEVAARHPTFAPSSLPVETPGGISNLQSPTTQPAGHCVFPGWHIQSIKLFPA